MSKKILVLGGHGFIGCHTSHVLSKFHDVAIVDCYHQYDLFPDWEYFPVLEQRRSYANVSQCYTGRIEDDSFMSGVFDKFEPEIVIHLATYPNAQRVRRNVADATNNMVTATTTILDLCVKHSVDRFVYASSSMAYGDFTEEPPTEELRCEPMTVYGAYKSLGERMCKIWHRDHGLEYTILRPSAVYGTRDMIDRVISKMTVSALKNKIITVDGNDNILDFTWVSEVGYAFALAATYPVAANEIYNSTRGNGRTVLEAAKIIQSIIPAEIIIDQQDGFYPLRGTLCSDKFRSLGWNPTIDIEQGIPKYVEWFLKQDFVQKHIVQ